MELTRRDVLFAGVASFVAWGLLVQQVPVLRWIGQAFVAGSLLTLLALLALILTTVRQSQSTDVEAPIRKTVLRFLTQPTWETEVTTLNTKAIYRREPLYPDSFVISNAFDSLLELILRDFVKVWYNEISLYPSFPNEVESAVRKALIKIRERLIEVDLIEVIVLRIVPILATHFKDFDLAEKAVRGEDLKRIITSSEELDLAIAKKYRDGKLHPAASLSVADTKTQQQQHLRAVTERILPSILEPEQAKSRAVNIFIREIVACTVLTPSLQLLADPDTINQLMENAGRATLQDRRTIRRLRAALDQHASPPPSSGHKVFALPKLLPHDTERKFERFIRSIRMCNDLSDARRVRSEVSSQLKRDSRNPDQNPTYVRRLQTGKRLLDQKVEELSADNAAPAKQVDRTKTQSSNGPIKSKLDYAPLSQILQDASGLSYFMEYMDRQSQMSLVQYWIVVDGLRNPLEEDIAEDDNELHGQLSWTDSDRADLNQIYSAYFSNPDLHIPGESKKHLKEFLAAGDRATPLQYQMARSAVLRTQTAILQRMQKEMLPSFKKSDLFYKLLTAEEASRRTAPRKEETATKPLSPTLNTDSLPRQAVTRAARKVTPKSIDLLAETPTVDRPVNANDGQAEGRVSSESHRSKPLFEDEEDIEAMSRSRQSINSDTFTDGPASDDVVQAMEAALNDIMEGAPGDMKGSEFGPAGGLFSATTDSPSGSVDLSRYDSFGSSHSVRPKPISIASLGLINTESRGIVFAGDSLFPEEEKFIEDEREDLPPQMDGEEEDKIHEAAPGDLGLAEAITALTLDIVKLTTQESIVQSLTRKAELTNNGAELRILGKSLASLQREIRRKELQRQQYIVQESDNSLYGRSTVRITSTLVGTESGKEYAVYLIEVERTSGDNMQTARWAIARRYSEFHDLHQKLRVKYPSTRHLDFPRRRVVLKLQKDFLERRKQGLQKYLQELLLLPDVCRSRELRSFLSQRAILSNDSESGTYHRDLVSRLYSSVSEGMEDLIGSIPVLDQLSATGQSLISAATGQLHHTFSRTASEDVLPTGMPISEDSMTSAEAEAELQAYENRELEPFVKPICDIFLEVFELNRGNNWLRGRAVVVVLHQLLGGTIERKIREYARNYFVDNTVIGYVDLLKDALWPGGVLRKEPPNRTDAEKAKSRREASLMLATLLPDVAGSVVGRQNAKAASRRIFTTFNNPRLNTHIFYVILDEIVSVLFPEKGPR